MSESTESITQEVNTTPKLGFLDTTREYLEGFFRQKKEVVRKNTAKEQSKLLSEIRDSHLYARNPNIMPAIRAGFTADNDKKAEGESALLVQLPNGKYQRFLFDHSKMGVHPTGTGIKGEEDLFGLIFPVEGGEVTIGRIGRANGYNTQFRVTFSGKTTNHTKPLVLAYQYAGQSIEYNTLSKYIDDLRIKINILSSKDPKYAQEIEENKRLFSKKTSLQKRRDIEKEIVRLRELRDKNTRDTAKFQEELVFKERKLSGIQKYNKDVVYTPYSENLDTPEMRSAGVKYLSKLVHSTWSEKIRASTEVNGIGPLSETLDPRIGVVLAIVERMDFTPYFNGKSILKPAVEYQTIMEAQIRSALVIFGANQDHSSKHHYNNVSKALGIAQITPTAHRLILDRYGSNILPETDYGKDLDLSGRDPTQSIRFMQVHLYDQLHVQTPSWIKSNWKNIKKDKEKMFGYYGILAAGYNGNMTRVKSEAFEKEKDLNLVDYSQIIKNVTGNNETLTYVLKFRYVWEYLTSNHPEIFVQQIGK